MKYRTIENASQVRLRNERRTLVQHNKFPLEDLMGKIVTKDRRANPDRRIEGVSRQKIWDTTSKKLRETFIHYSLVSSVHI